MCRRGREVLLPSFEGTRELQGLLAGTHLRLGLLPRRALLARLPWHARRAAARTNGKPLAREPRLEDAPDDVEGASLHYSATNELAASDADVDDALEREREAVGGVLVELLWDQRRRRLWWVVVGR